LTLRDNNRKLFTNAEATDKKVTPVVQYIWRQSENFGRFAREVQTSLPEIDNSISKIVDDIGEYILWEGLNRNG
jgi:hypothetical protein